MNPSKQTNNGQPAKGLQMTNLLVTSLADQFNIELSRISSWNVKRRALLAVNTLAVIETYSLNCPKIAARAKKLMVDACDYNGEYWIDNGEKTTGELSLISTYK